MAKSRGDLGKSKPRFRLEDKWTPGSSSSAPASVRFKRGGGMGSSAGASERGMLGPSKKVSGRPERELYDKKPSKFNTVKAQDVAPKAKPAYKGASSGSITKPSPAVKKARDDLGAFYLNATSGMDIHSRPKKKK